ncbi:unnamed protein product [Adineta steineri]|uniref:Uncharacterized protein n=1 Tax=Adineta steineri TaxID=433720 RepID=A0A815JA97_9BILA|nr:unnamed protein product [Adineta steineri]CAF4066359.1 unnamed protein product [Adineta steineri]
MNSFIQHQFILLRQEILGQPTPKQSQTASRAATADNVFKNTPAMDLKLIVGNRNRRDAKNELIRKRPKRSLLQCKQIQNKYKKMLGKLLS